MKLGRRAVLLSASAALHAAAVAAALVIAGAGSGSVLFVDLSSVDLIAASAGAGGEPSPAPAASVRPAPANRPRPARTTARSARAPAAAMPPAPLEPANVAPAPSASPRFELSRESAPSEGAVAAEAGPSVASGQTAGAAEAGAAGSSGGASGVLRDGGGLAGSGGALLALAAPGEGPSGVPAEYGPYLARFRQRIQEALVYPLAARRQGLSGSVELEVLVEPNGQIRSVRLLSSSSHAVLDEAALDAVRALAPLPLPEHLPRRPLKIRLPVVFHLR
jgi:protein TonB